MGTPILSDIAKGKYVVIPGIITVAVRRHMRIAATWRIFGWLNVCLADSVFELGLITDLGSCLIKERKRRHMRIALNKVRRVVYFSTNVNIIANNNCSH
jgi:hypothetical protein